MHIHGGKDGNAGGEADGEFRGKYFTRWSSYHDGYLYHHLRSFFPPPRVAPDVLSRATGAPRIGIPETVLGLPPKHDIL